MTVSRSRWGKIVRRTLLLLALLLVALEGYQLATEQTLFTSAAANLLFENNLHTVVPGKLYRSAEMPPEALGGIIRRFGIATVLDLRLGKDGHAYPAGSEERAVKEAGAAYVSVPLKGSREPTREEVEALLSAFDRATPPVLVHCTSGTHRSGVASALWLIDKEGLDPRVAAEQLSLQYGFVYAERRLKGLIQGHPTIDGLVWDYLTAYQSTGVKLRDWVSALPSGQGRDISVPEESSVNATEN